MAPIVNLAVPPALWKDPADTHPSNHSPLHIALSPRPPYRGAAKEDSHDLPAGWRVMESFPYGGAAMEDLHNLPS